VVQGPKGRIQRPEGPKSRPNAEAGFGAGEGHWVSLRQLRSLGSAPTAGFKAQRDHPMIFHCFGHWKMPLLNKKCDWAFIILGQKTGHCTVLFGQKIMTGHLPKKPDSPVKNRTPGSPNLIKAENDWFGIGWLQVATHCDFHVFCTSICCFYGCVPCIWLPMLIPTLIKTQHWVYGNSKQTTNPNLTLTLTQVQKVTLLTDLILMLTLYFVVFSHLALRRGLPSYRRPPQTNVFLY